MTTVHRFSEIVYRNRDRPDLRDFSAVIKTGFYSPLNKDCSLPLDLMVSSAQNCEWPSCSPQSMAGLYAEMSVMLERRRLEDHAGAVHSWLSLLCEPGWLFRRVGTETWILSLGPVQGIALLMWPVTKIDCEGKSVYAIKSKTTSSEIALQVVTDPNEYEVLVSECVSPLSILARRVA